MSKITDAHVTRALRAYEELPPQSVLEARMRAALEAVYKSKSARDGGTSEGT